MHGAGPGLVVEDEEVAAKAPELIFIEPFHPDSGLQPYQVRKLCAKLDIRGPSVRSAEKFMRSLCKLFVDLDCSLAEINPLVVTKSGELIALGTNTDPYQPCEGRYRLTRGILQAFVDTGNPFSIVTKSPLIERDLDLLVAATRSGSVHVDISVGCLDHSVWRSTEPHAPSPARRLQTVTALTDAGVSCGVLVAPVLPGISDDDQQLDRLVHAAVHAGARSIATVPLHLRPGVREHYLEWLGESHPDLLPDHMRRFRTSYQPDDDRRTLAARVQELAATHRRQANRVGGLPRTPRRQRPAPDPAHSTRAEDQLRLL